MCQKYIGCGKCSKSYIYILLGFVLKTLDDNFFTFTSVAPKMETNIFGINPVLSKHMLIQNFYKYISFIIGGTIFLFIIIKKNTKEQKTRNFLLSDIKASSSFRELPRLLQYKKDPIHKPILEIIIVSMIYVLHFEVLDILYTFKISNLSFWTLEILFIIIFLKKYFVIKFYNFQKCSFIFFVSSVTLLLMVSINLPLKVTEQNQTKCYDILFSLVDKKYILFILAFIFINFNHAFISYARVKAKVLMDFKYIYPYTLIFFIGIFGIIITSIELTFSSLYECGEKYQDFCMVASLDGNNNLYLDNITIYFNGLKEKKLTELIIELVILLPIFLIINFFESVCEFLVIIKLNPIFVLIQNNFAYGINYLIYVIFKFDHKYKREMLNQFFVIETGEIIGIICYMIYLEIIELRFCGLDTYLNRNLLLLSTAESQITDDENIEEDIDKNTDYTLYSEPTIY